MAEEAAENVEVQTDTPAGSATEATTTDEPALNAENSGAVTPSLEERLATAEEARQKAEKSYSELRSLNDRRFNQMQGEVQRLKQSRAEADPEAATAEREAQRMASLEERQAITDFRVAHPDHADVWTEMIRYAQDNPHQVVARREDGVIDYSASLDNAYARVKLGKYEQQQVKNREKAAAAQTQRIQAKAQATISGGGTSPPEVPPDVAKMTSDEMILAGLVEYDENDPPEIIRKQRRGLVK